MSGTKLRLFANADREPNIDVRQLVEDLLVATTDAAVLAAVGAVIAEAPTGTLASPPGGLASGDLWLDTTGGGTADPIVRFHV